MVLIRLKLQKGEGKLLVASPEIRTRRRRAKRASSSPKISLIGTLEERQVLSQEAEIEEVQFVQEFELIEEVQASKFELESIAIMPGFGETKGNSKENDVNKNFNDINRMVKIMF